MSVKRARVELDYDDLRLLCNHYPIDLEDPTMIEIDGEEYIGVINVSRKKNSFIIKIDICK
jgi:hypothetical protein